MDPSREAYWANKLRPIRLRAESVGSQLGKKFAVTVVITFVTITISQIVLGIFAVFGRGDIGLLVIGLSFLPVTLWFWLDYAVLHHRASAFLRERGAESSDADPPG